MKTLITIALILSSFLSYSQNKFISTLSTDSIEFYVMEYYSSVIDSIGIVYKYDTKQVFKKKWYKNSGEIVLDTFRIDTVNLKHFKYNSKLADAARYHSNYIKEVSRIENSLSDSPTGRIVYGHYESEYHKGIKINVDTILNSWSDRGNYFNVRASMEVVIVLDAHVAISKFAPYYASDTKSMYDISRVKLYRSIAKELINGLMLSPSHKSILLSNRTNVGFGIAISDSYIVLTGDLN